MPHGGFGGRKRHEGAVGISLLLKELLGWLQVSHLGTATEKFAKAGEVAMDNKRLPSLAEEHRVGRPEVTEVPGSPPKLGNTSSELLSYSLGHSVNG